MYHASQFLVTILRDPSDDAPRLVFADWLDDNGEAERAELIRVQCELAQLSSRDRRWHELSWRAEELLAQHGDRWRRDLPVLEGVEWTEFERGFVSTVRVTSVESLYKHAADIGRVAPVFRVELSHLVETAPFPRAGIPWLRVLRIHSRGERSQVHSSRSLLSAVQELEVVGLREYEDLSWLADSGGQTALNRLKVEGSHTVGLGFVQRFANEAWTAGLTRLELGTRFVDYNSGYFQDPTLGPAGAEYLAGARHMNNLEALNLNRQRIETRGLGVLLSSANLSGLKELDVRSCQITELAPLSWRARQGLLRLDLSQNPFGTAGVEELARSPRLRQLEWLGLDTCEISSDGLELLTRALFWKSLRHLDLGRNPLGTAGAWVLAQAEPPENLHTLLLADCDFDSEAGKALLAIPWLRNLLSLDLSSNNLANAGLTGISSLAGGSLRFLNLSTVGIDGGAMSSLAPLLSQLVVLDLSRAMLRDGGMDQLLAGRRAPHLQRLRLQSCGLNQRGIKFLSDTDFPQLHTLNLAGNQLSVPALRQLLKSPLLATLRDLDLSNTQGNPKTAVLLAGTPALGGLKRFNLVLNAFDEAGLLSLARSAHLRGVPSIQLTGNPWSFSVAGREELEKRFGRYWYYNETEEEEEYAEDDFLDEDEDEENEDNIPF